MNKVWQEPQVMVQPFVANEYVAACGDTNNEYIFKCDAMGGITGTVYRESNGNNKLDLFGDEYLGSGYHACGEEHVTQTGDEFINGWYVNGKEGFEGGGWYKQVIIWKGPQGNNIHCTTNLDMNSWTVAKS